MDESARIIEKLYKDSAKNIVPGADYTMYLIYCTACNVYKRVSAAAPVGPGGTLDCPLCRLRKENGPFLEGCYGRVTSKRFNIELPDEVQV